MRRLLRREIAAGVVFWVGVDEERVTGLMGIQDKGDVALVRHAYVAPTASGPASERSSFAAWKASSTSPF